MSNNLIPFIKVWNDRQGHYGQKEYWFNPTIEIKGLEGCKIKNGNDEVECTKIFYPDNFLTLLGTPKEFFEKCREGNISICLLEDLRREGITMKQFIQQNERFNNVEIS